MDGEIVTEYPDLGQELHATAQVTELRNRMADFAVPHVLEPKTGRVSGLVTGIALGSAKLAFIKYGAPIRVVAQATDEQVCWTIPIGPMRVEVGRSRAKTMREGFLLDPDNRTVMEPSPERGAVVVTTHATALQQQLTQLVGNETARLRFKPGPSTAAVKGQVDLAWQYVAASLALTPDPPEALRHSLGQTLLTAMLLELQQPQDVLDVTDAGEPGRQHARRAAEWAAENFTKPVRVTEWARGVAISVRHLQATMLAEYGCTPREYLLKLRLERAHALLREAGPDDTITGIASAAGFSHLGRFAAQYRDRYGHSPSQELKQAS
ncbi:AraC family transcriptional regulator [Enemella sp. A6]|uniref:AraC family transcriptional regulator n=1 Tax=Enemella sp. A6 TaxID=3440152 RepID=UPI003EBDDA09